MKFNFLHKASFLVAMLACCIASVSTLPRIAKAVDGEITYTGTNTLLTGDDVSAGPFNIGFTFPFYGTNYTQAYVNINGTLNFATGYNRYSNVPLNTAISGTNIADNSIFAFWDDLNTNGSQNIYYATVGTAPNRMFVTQWTNIYFHGTSVQLGTFQAILYETSNIVQIQYRDLLGGDRALGNSATIGLRKNNSLSHQYSHNTASLVQEQAIRYTPDGNGSYTVNTNAPYELVYLAPAGAPTSPTLVNPTDGTSGVTLTPTFEWLPVDSATSYTVLISTVSNFSSTVVNQSGITGTSYTPGSALGQNTTYYWRVQAVNSSGSSLSPTRSFTTGSTNNAPSTPSSVTSAVMTGSATTSNIVGATLTATLTDPDDNEQVRYRIQIATDSGFSDLIVDYRSPFGNEGSITYTYGEEDGTYLVGMATTTLAVDSYYLRIRTEDDAAASSAWYTVSGVAFNIIVAPDTTPPIISSVAVSSIGTSTATISWSTNENASSRIDYGTTVEYGSSSSTVSLITSHTLYLAGLTPATVYNYRIQSADSESNTATTTNATFTTESLPDTTAPGISGISVSPENNSATIFWTTDELASSLVLYGPSSTYTASTTEINTSTRVTEHEVVIENLRPCVTYHYSVVSRDVSDNSVESNDNSFTTKDCAGDAVVTAQIATTVATSTGGVLDLMDSDRGISISIPPAFSTTSARFQIKKIDDTTARTAIGIPSGTTPAGTYTYELHAVTDELVIIESFEEPLTLTLAYGSQDIVGIVETSLKIYRWNGSSWQQLSDCVVDTNAKTVTCSTDHFSTFGLFGEDEPTEDQETVSSSRSRKGGSRNTVTERVRKLLEVGNNSLANELIQQYPQAFTASVAMVSPKSATSQPEEQLQSELQRESEQEPQLFTTEPVTILEEHNKKQCKLIAVSRTLRSGMVGEDVRELQKFLNCAGFYLASSGPGSPGNETDLFSVRTYLALVKFQEAYAQDILTPLGRTQGTGIFGDLSRSFAQKFSQN